MDLQVKSHETEPVIQPLERFYASVIEAICRTDVAPEAIGIVGTISAVIARLRDLEGQAKAKAVELIERDGPATIGTVNYWTGHDKTVKCIDQRATVELALTLLAGDVDGFTKLLGSNAVKYGAFKRLLEEHNRADEYERHYATTVKDTLESGEKLPRKLQSADTKYLA